jgi:hypothetical protein
MINKSKRFIPCMLTLENRDEYVVLKETIKEKMNAPTTVQVTYKHLSGILEALNHYEATCKK